MNPYKSTAEFDEITLPAALRNDHATKAGVWGVIRVSAGAVRLTLEDGSERTVSPADPALVEPEQRHRVEPLGPVRMSVDFYRERPLI
jgi:tellurite resistance-related uncharacterized protein